MLTCFFGSEESIFLLPPYVTVDLRVETMLSEFIYSSSLVSVLGSKDLGIPNAASRRKGGQLLSSFSQPCLPKFWEFWGVLEKRMSRRMYDL